MNDAYVFAERSSLQISYIVPVNGNFTRFDFIKTGNEVTDSRLASAGRADKRNGLACLNLHRKVFYNFIASVVVSVSESYVLKLYFPFKNACFYCVIRLFFGGNVHNVAKTFKARHSLLNLFVNGGQGADGRNQSCNIKHKRGKFADVDKTVIKEQSAR